jgi:hypothetical protein
LPVSGEYDTGEGAGEGPVGGTGRFVGVKVARFADTVVAGFGGVPAEFARSATPARSPPLGGAGESVTAGYPLLRTA